MEANWTEHASVLDASVNWTRPTSDGGQMECRYVRRTQDYFIGYLSSHSGCSHACRFCHLTQTGQTMFAPASLWDVSGQLMQVIGHYDRAGQPASRMHVNFMARGDLLSNKDLLSSFRNFGALTQREAARRDMTAVINVSTIFPKDSADLDLVDVFGRDEVVFYWSLYSLDDRFRRRWLPKAEDPARVMDRLLDWQARTGRDVVLHWAMIDGENDAEDQLAKISEFVDASGLRARLNLVRYNPHSPKAGAEASESRYDRALELLSPLMKIPGSRVVPRVGMDVKASCGMFMEASR